LSGEEIRACWQSGERLGPEALGEAASGADHRTPVRSRRDFVPVEPGAPEKGASALPASPLRSTGARPAGGPGPVRLIATPLVGAGSAWSLFPELDDQG
jgi:hypothetical protein